MYLGIYLVLCCAILSGFASGAQKSSLNSDLTFPDRDAVEGSGNDSEVTPDLESSGSGYGPDDEDTPVVRLKAQERGNSAIDTHRTDHNNRNYDNKDIDTHDTIDTSIVHRQPSPTQPVTEDPDVKMNKPDTNRPPFFAQPGILAAVIGGAVVGLLCAILVVMFIVYRMRKKDEGSYALGEPKQSPTVNSYSRGNNKEFYA